MANEKISKDIEFVNNGVATCLYEGFPTLFMQFSRKPTWVDEPNWYNNIEYVKDLERGVPYMEDLWVPGYFEIPIKKGESVIFSAGINEVNPRSLARMYQEEISHRTPRTSFFNCLKNAAKQFYLRENDKMYILSGYPWGIVLARNTFMSVPGLTLAIDHKADYESIMKTALDALVKYYNTGDLDSRIHGIDEPDIALWAAWAIQQYAKIIGEKEARDRYLDTLGFIIDSILANKHPILQVDGDTGLVRTDNGDSRAVSWMNSTLHGRPVVPRTGYLVEMNALFYNALCFTAKLVGDNATKEELVYRKRWEDAAEKMKKPFVDTFLNDAGYLYDYVNGSYTDLAVRPNMAVAIGLDFSPLDRRQRKSVLDVVTRELLTPKGLRTLSPRSYGYRPFYLGSPDERDMAMHNGPARPWLIGFYADAYLRVFGMSGVSYIDRMLIGFEDEMSQGCIGSLSQLYDGNPPFNGRGAISHATNVAEVLLTLRNLKKLNL